MDIRSERELRIELEKEFGSGSRLLADALCSKEIYELNDGIRNKIAYLMEICQDFSIDDPGIIYAVSSLSMDEIEERYEKYAKLPESTK